MNRVQYVRLISEIFAVGFTEDQMKELCESMDLTWNEIEEIYQYAEIEWDKEKSKLY
jgi:hypothetical protein